MGARALDGHHMGPPWVKECSPAFRHLVLMVENEMGQLVFPIMLNEETIILRPNYLLATHRRRKCRPLLCRGNQIQEK